VSLLRKGTITRRGAKKQWFAENLFEASFISDKPDNILKSKLWTRNNVNLRVKGNITATPTFKWKTDLGSPYLYPLQQPIVADIDKDGTCEIVLVRWYSGHAWLCCFNAETGVLKWVTSDIPELSVKRLSAFDIDQDGFIEILCPAPTAGANQGLWCFKHDGTVKWKSNIDTMYSVACYDIDSDGQIELIVAGEDTIYCYNNKGEVEWSKPITQPTTVIVADINNDGLPEIVTHTYTSASPGYIHYLDYKGDILKTITIQRGSIYPLCVYDVNNDGKMEVLYYARYTAGIPTTQNIGLLDSDGNTLWTYDTGYGLDIHQAAIYDVDGDGYAEIFIAGKYTGAGEFLAFKYDGTLLWSYSVPEGQTEAGVVLADINGDGKLEAIFISRLGIIYCFNAATGDLLWTFNNVGIMFYNVAVADVDKDGLAEIIYGGGDDSGNNWFRLACLE